MISETRNCLFSALLCLFAIVPASAGPVPPQAATATDGTATAGSTQKAEEITSRDVAATFRSNVNLVMVPVVVRDERGNAIGNLRREDFRIFDDGKLQVIKHFSMETPATRTARSRTTAAEASAAVLSPTTVAPRRFVAYVFDDLHLDTGEIVRSREAAARHLASLPPDERVALYTTSGQNIVEFTDDVAKVREALLRIAAPPSAHLCPDLGPYWAGILDSSSDWAGIIKDRVTNDSQPPTYREDRMSPALAEAMKQAGACPEASPDTLGYLRNRITEILMESDRDALTSLQLLRSVVRKMSSLPGERTVVAVSPGFLTRNREEDLAEVVNRAIQGRVVINSLDARGVHTPARFDAASNIETDTIADEKGVRQMFKSNEMLMQADVLGNLADSTGGVFFGSNNDLGEGFRRTSGVPEYSYLLGFAPANSGQRGFYHKLKVTVDGKLRPVSIQARRGYFAAGTPTDPAEVVRRQIEAAMFSADEISEIPIQLRTSFFKKTYKDATLNVSVRIDLKQLPLRKVEDRNSDDLEVFAAIFDRNGNYVTGKAKLLELRLRDETLKSLAGGANIKTDFDLTSGNYLLRVVVRDKEGPLMAASSTPVQIP